MAEITEFAHTFQDGDDFGVVFSGPPTAEPARLAVSTAYIWTLFLSVLQKESKAGEAAVPLLVTEWNTGRGWCGVVGKSEVTEQDSLELARALRALSSEDLSDRVSLPHRDEFLRCAECIAAFIYERVTRGLSLFIEDE